MAIRFKGTLEELRNDLATGGYLIQKVQQVAGGLGHELDVQLVNGVVICWDSASNFIWAEGPVREMTRVERYLRRIFECSWLIREVTFLYARLSRELVYRAFWLRRHAILAYVHFRRELPVWYTRFRVLMRKLNRRAAAWILRSEGPAARLLRRLIERVPARVPGFRRFRTPAAL
ncbi:MAG: hypothetical protein QM790_10735 [Nibricoccus sp.]